MIQMNLRTQNILNLIQFAWDHGVEPGYLCQLSNLNWEKLKSGTQEPDLASLNQLWQNAVKLTNDAFLGLHLGEHYNLTALGIVGQIIQSSSTIKTALEYTCQFFNLISPAFQMQIEQNDEHFSLIFRPDPQCFKDYAFAVLQSIDTTMVFSVNEYRGLVLDTISPLELSLAKPRPDGWQEYQRIFKCPIHFDAPRFELKFDSSYLSRNIITADYELLNLLTTHAQGLLQRLPKKRTFTQLVKRCLIDQSNGNFPTINDVARRLNLSTRSLQRHLKEEGSHFQTLLDEVRQDFAKHFLQKQTPIKEIAYILGYNGVSAFSRSFKRWTGKTPGAFQVMNDKYI